MYGTHISVVIKHWDVSMHWQSRWLMHLCNPVCNGYLTVSTWKVQQCLLGWCFCGLSTISGGFWEVVKDIVGGSKYVKCSVDKEKQSFILSRYLDTFLHDWGLKLCSFLCTSDGYLAGLCCACSPCHFGKTRSIHVGGMGIPRVELSLPGLLPAIPLPATPTGKPYLWQSLFTAPTTVAHCSLAQNVRWRDLLHNDGQGFQWRIWRSRGKGMDIETLQKPLPFTRGTGVIEVW
jgi:hypothetical protein